MENKKKEFLSKERILEILKKAILLRECELEEKYECETLLHEVLLKEMEMTEEEYQEIMN